MIIEIHKFHLVNYVPFYLVGIIGGLVEVDGRDYEEEGDSDLEENERVDWQRFQKAAK